MVMVAKAKWLEPKRQQLSLVEVKLNTLSGGVERNSKRVKFIESTL